MKKEVVLASRNEGKLAEMQALLSPLQWKLLPISDFTEQPAEEPAPSFVENAILKARYASLVSGLPAIADDSGIEVDALGGQPGVHSARYSGEDATDSSNNQKLLQALKGINDPMRGARYICVIVYLRNPDDPTPIIAQAMWRGSITSNPRGTNGFGYDPLFYVAEHKCSAAELDAAVKNKVSHRAKAIKHLYSLLHDAAGPL